MWKTKFRANCLFWQACLMTTVKKNLGPREQPRSQKKTWAYLGQQLAIASNSGYRLHLDCGQKVSLTLDFLQNIGCFLESIWVLLFDPLNRNLPFVVFSRGLCWYLENLQIKIKSYIFLNLEFEIDLWWNKTQKFEDNFMLKCTDYLWF